MGKNSKLKTYNEGEWIELPEVKPGQIMETKGRKTELCSNNKETNKSLNQQPS